MASPSPRLERVAQIVGGLCLVGGAVWFGFQLWQSNTTATVWFDNGDPTRAMIVHIAGERFDVGAQSATSGAVKAGRHKAEITDGGGMPVGGLEVDIAAGRHYVLNISKVNRYRVMSGTYGGTPGPITEDDVPVQEWYDVSEHDFILSGLPPESKGAGRKSAFVRLEPVTPHITVRNTTSASLRLIIDGGELVTVKAGDKTTAAMKVGPRHVILLDTAGKEIAAYKFTAFSGGEYEVDASKPGEVVTKK
jgi:hypothetical protein